MSVETGCGFVHCLNARASCRMFGLSLSGQFDIAVRHVQLPSTTKRSATPLQHGCLLNQIVAPNTAKQEPRTSAAAVFGDEFYGGGAEWVAGLPVPIFIMFIEIASVPWP
jgi:hypothetical protein